MGLEIRRFASLVHQIASPTIVVEHVQLEGGRADNPHVVDLWIAVAVQDDATHFGKGLFPRQPLSSLKPIAVLAAEADPSANRWEEYFLSLFRGQSHCADPEHVDVVRLLVRIDQVFVEARIFVHQGIRKRHQR